MYKKNLKFCRKFPFLDSHGTLSALTVGVGVGGWVQASPPTPPPSPLQ